MQNATDLTSSIKIQGTPGFKFDALQGLDRFLNINRIRPRSYSFLCITNNVRLLKWKNVLYEFGHRSDSDVVLHLQKQFIDTKVLSKESIPKFTFLFENAEVNMSYVSVMADVSVK